VDFVQGGTPSGEEQRGKEQPDGQTAHPSRPSPRGVCPSLGGFVVGEKRGHGTGESIPAPKWGMEGKALTENLPIGEDSIKAWARKMTTREWVETGFRTPAREKNSNQRTPVGTEGLSQHPFFAKPHQGLMNPPDAVWREGMLNVKRVRGKPQIRGHLGKLPQSSDVEFEMWGGKVADNSYRVQLDGTPFQGC